MIFKSVYIEPWKILTISTNRPSTSQYKLKRRSKGECCKPCRHVKFKSTMTKCPVHRKTHSTIQKHVEHQDATDIQNYVCVFFGFFFIFIYVLFIISPRNVELSPWYGH